MLHWVLHALPFAAGVFVTLQGVTISEHARSAGKIFAALWNRLSSAVIAFFAYLIAQRATITPLCIALQTTPWWMYLGGTAGALYVTLISFLVVRVGAGNFAVTSCFAELIAAILADHWGVLGLSVHRATATSVIGVLFTLAGVVLVNVSPNYDVCRIKSVARKTLHELNAPAAVRKSHISMCDLDSCFNDVKEVNLGDDPAIQVVVKHPPVIVATAESKGKILGTVPTSETDIFGLVAQCGAALAGILLTLQAVINGALGTAYGPWFATVISQSIASVILLFVFLVTMVVGTGEHRSPSFKNTRWWGWTSGIVGFLQIAAGALLVPILGSSLFLSASVAAQVITSIIIDHFGFFGLEKRRCGVLRSAGCSLVCIGIIVVHCCP